MQVGLEEVNVAKKHSGHHGIPLNGACPGMNGRISGMDGTQRGMSMSRDYVKGIGSDAKIPGMNGEVTMRGMEKRIRW